jgi:hypothetical protein
MKLIEVDKEIVEAVLRIMDSQSGTRERVARALIAAHAQDSGWPHILEMWDDKFVYSIAGKTYERSFTSEGESVKLGNSTPMTLAYIPLAEAVSVESTGEFIPLELKEAATSDGVIRIKLIAPGQGSSAYYTEAALKRAAEDKIFHKGLPMFWNHQTAQEATSRPEGDLNQLAAELQSDAEYSDAYAEGPGLYSLAKPARKHYAEAIKELSANTGFGLSIRASGDGFEGKIDGRKTVVLERFTRAKSVDFVTRAGAGGKVIEVFEAAGREPVELIEGGEKMATVQIEESELQTLRNNASKVTVLESAIAELRLDGQRTKAVSFVTAYINGIKDLQEATKKHLIAVVTPNVVLTEAGLVDEAANVSIADAAVTEHKAYLASLGVGPTAKVQTLGGLPVKESAAAPVNLEESINSKAKRFLGEKEGK